MIKTILVLLAKVLESKLVKSGLEEALLKNQNYITTAKQIWNAVEENFRITKTVEEKIASKADEFDKMLLAKFPELTQNDISELRQAVAGEVNQGKDAALSELAALKILQDRTVELQTENASLKEQLSKFQSLAAATVNTDVQQTV